MMYGKAAAFFHYEKELKAEIVQYLKRGGNFFDVGANIGLISFFVNEFCPQAQITAFEPGNVMFGCLKATVTQNNLQNITLVKKGIADKKRNAEFFIEPNSTGGSSISRKHYDKNRRNVEKIELISLDEYVCETGTIPDLVKVDVEGAENLVVDGARELIIKHRPIFIIESENKNILDKIDLWKQTFKDYRFRKVGHQDFYSVEELEVIIMQFSNDAESGADYLFVPN